MIARVLILQPILLFGENLFVQIDKVERFRAKRLEALHQLKLLQQDLLLFAHSFDRHFHLEDLAIAAEHFLRSVDFNEMYVLGLFALQLETLRLEVGLEHPTLVGAARVRIV